jgi:hypothetical protein
LLIPHSSKVCDYRNDNVRLQGRKFEARARVEIKRSFPQKNYFLRENSA